MKMTQRLIYALLLSTLALMGLDPQPSSAQPPKASPTRSIHLLADGFNLLDDQLISHTFSFASSQESIRAKLGEPDSLLGFGDDLLLSYRDWGMLLWITSPKASLHGIILTAHPMDNPHAISLPIHFYHDAITTSHGSIQLGDALYQAQAIGKTFGSYRISQATFRSHDHYLMINSLKPLEQRVALVAYSMSNPEAPLRRYYPPEAIYLPD